MRGTLPAARKQQRYVAARTRFVGFARRGARACSRAAAGSDLFGTHATGAPPAYALNRLNTQELFELWNTG